MDLTTEAVRLGLNMAHLRAEIASENIANVDVPGYRTQRTDFGRAIGLLNEAASQPSTDADSLRNVTQEDLRGTVQREASGSGAVVSLDGEVAQLETANVDFQALSTVLSRRFGLMQLALNGKG